MKQKTQKKFLVAMIIFSMMAIYGAVPFANAVSLTLVKDTLSTSANSQTATHTINFTMANALDADDTIVVTFPAGFTGMATPNVSCPANSNGSAAGQVVTCLATGAVGAGAKTISVTSVTNPATSTSYLFTVETKDEGSTVIENAQYRVAIIDQVTMTASVDAALTFTISGTSTGAVINGVATTEDSTATTTAFGTLSTTGSTTLGQILTVATNASNGYKVTVEQDHDLLNSTGNTIDSFIDDVASTTAQAWQAPANTLDATSTYGHMGFTSQDTTLSDGDHYGNSLYQGFDGTTPVEVMYHTGPADGQTNHKGWTSVAYTIQIKDLQEAGDYSNTLTYICTPTY